MSHVARFSTPCGRFYVCPYNRSHEVKWSRAVNHLAKCERLYPQMTLVVCPSNALHRMLESEMSSHLKMCPDHLKMQVYMYEESTRTCIADSARAPCNSVAAGVAAKEGHLDTENGGSATVGKQARTGKKQEVRTAAKASTTTKLPGWGYIAE